MDELALHTTFSWPYEKNKVFHVCEKAPGSNGKALGPNIIEFKSLALKIPRYGL